MSSFSPGDKLLLIYFNQLQQRSSQACGLGMLHYRMFIFLKNVFELAISINIPRKCKLDRKAGTLMQTFDYFPQGHASIFSIPIVRGLLFTSPGSFFCVCDISGLLIKSCTKDYLWLFPPRTACQVQKKMVNSNDKQEHYNSKALMSLPCY